MSTTAHGAGWPYSRSFGTHWVLMIFHSASGSAAREGGANATSATSAARTRRRDIYSTTMRGGARRAPSPDTLVQTLAAISRNSSAFGEHGSDTVIGRPSSEVS